MSNAPEQTPEQKKASKVMVYKMLNYTAVLYGLSGVYLLVKDKFSDFTLIDAESDIFLGAALLVVAVADVIIADKFFKDR